MQIRGYTTEEVVRLGRDIYERKIRSEVEPERDGEFVVVDVTTSHYEFDESEVAASDRALRKNPDAVLYFLRVGRHTAYRRRRMGAAVAMRGNVTADGREPILPIEVSSPSGGNAPRVEALVDTGFDGELTLRPATVQSLGLPLIGFDGRD